MRAQRVVRDSDGRPTGVEVVDLTDGEIADLGQLDPADVRLQDRKNRSARSAALNDERLIDILLESLSGQAKASLVALLRKHGSTDA